MCFAHCTRSWRCSGLNISSLCAQYVTPRVPCCRNEIQIARTANGKKMRIGEGSSGTVYKALMHGCDEVAVKLVKKPTPTEQERDGFYREVLL